MKRWASLCLALVLCSGCSRPWAGSGPDAEPPATTAEQNAPVAPFPSSTVPKTTAERTDTDDDPIPPEVEAIAWSRCHGDFECGTVEVPLDHTSPAGEQIGLAVLRAVATGPSAEGTIVVNPGGPGASGVDFVRATAGLHPDLRDRFHVLGFDPRGVGASEPLGCESGWAGFRTLDPEPDSAAEQSALDEAARGLAEDCAASAGRLLDHIGTASVVQDVEILRRAIGDDGLTYLGFSYGTAIGLHYAERYPDRVRAMVLDGVVDPSHGLEEFLAGQTVGIEATMAEVFASCVPSDGCPLDSPAATYDRLAERVEREPIPSDLGPVGPAELISAAVATIYDPARWPTFHRALADAERDEGDGLAQLAADYGAFGAFAAYTAVLCADSPHPSDGAAYQDFARRLGELSPRYGSAVANELLPCAYWPTAPTTEPGPIRAAGAPPILVVNKTRDAATPLTNAERVAEALDAAVLLVHDADGHTSFGQDRCVDRIVIDHLRSPTPADGRLHCP